MRHLILAAASAALVACSDGVDEPQRASEAAPIQAQPVAEAAPAVLPGDPTELLVPGLAEKYAHAAPAADDWTAESFYAAIGPTLHEIEQLLSDEDELEPADVAHFVNPGGAGFSGLRNARAEPRFDDGLFAVLPSSRPEEQEPGVGSSGLAEALRELVAPFAHARAEHVAFKVERVLPLADDGMRARLVYHAVGDTARGRLQQNGAWSTDWRRSGETWLLDSAEGSCEEVTLESERDGLFADVTAAVLGANPSYQRQLLVGLEQWSGTLDAALGVSIIGHEGLAVGDVNGDALDDLYVCQPGGLPNLLFVRNADGTATDTSQWAGLDWLDASRSALFVDLDGDGDQDLVVEADPSLFLMENDGQGRFALKFEANAPSTTSLAAADYDLDGDVDLFACAYMLPDEKQRIPIPYHDANNGRPNTFLQNDIEGDQWIFTDVTARVGLDRNNRRYSFSAAWEDYDDDGDPDLYVSNDFGRNNLYRNDDGRFLDVAAEAGVEDMAAGMGVTWSDADLDGHMDLFVANMYSSAGGRLTYQRRFQQAAGEEVRESYQRHARGNTLFRNLGDGRFADVSEAAGVTMGRWAWGALFLDLQNDGLPDLVVPNGFVTGEDPNDL